MAAGGHIQALAGLLAAISAPAGDWPRGEAAEAPAEAAALDVRYPGFLPLYRRLAAWSDGGVLLSGVAAPSDAGPVFAAPLIARGRLLHPRVIELCRGAAGDALCDALALWRGNPARLLFMNGYALPIDSRQWHPHSWCAAAIDGGRPCLLETGAVHGAYYGFAAEPAEAREWWERLVPSC